MTRHSFFATVYALGIGLFGIAALIALTDGNALFAQAGPLALFVALSFVLKRAGFHAAPQVTHSLVGIVDLAAVLIFGPILGAWVAALSGFFYLFLNALRHEKHTRHNLIELPIFNAGLKIGMAYASTHAYLWLGGTFPPRQLTPVSLAPLLGAVLAWFVCDHIGWGALEFLRGGRAGLLAFYRSIFIYSLLMELVPLPFAIVIAVTYVSGDPGIFLMLAFGLVGTALIVQRFADTSARLEQRRRELTALNEFGQALTRATFDAEQVIDLLYAHTPPIAFADLVRIELDDGKGGMILALEATRGRVQHPNQRQDDSPLPDYFSRQRNPLRVRDAARSLVVPADATAVAMAVLSRAPIAGATPRSALIVPLFAGDAWIGAMSLFCARPRAFFRQQEQNLVSMCAQAAVAIQNARLYAAERKRAAQLAIISQVSRQVASFLDIDELLQNVVAQIRDRFGYSSVHIFTMENESGYVLFRASTHPRGAEWRARGVRLRVGLEGIVGWVAATREPLLVNDVRQEKRFLLDPDKALADTCSELAVPLICGEQVRGVLDVQSAELNAFNDDDLFVLKTLAAQVAIALEDARLYNAQREEAYYLNVLLQVAQNLTAATNLDEALETVVRITPLLVGVARCVILVYDASAQVFVPAKVYGLSRDLQEEFQKLRFPADNALLFGKLAREQKPLLIEDAAASELIDPRYPQTFDIRSLLVVPLMTRGEIVGALLVDQGARPTRFTPHEIDVVMGIAHQAGAAIESMRLAGEAEEKKRMEYELGLARQIQTSFLPEACPRIPGYQIGAMWQTAREVSGDFYDFVTLHSHRLGITIADVSDKGMAAALFMALARTILRTMAIGKPTPREAVERANDVILADARAEMFVTVCYAVLDPQQHRVTYVNAGHMPPLLYRAAQDQVSTLSAHGIALGVVPNITLDEYQVDLAPGDVLLFYTDGLTDAINAQEEEFGMERLAALVAANARASSDTLVAEISRAVTEFAGEGVCFDDLTMVVLRRMADGE